MVILLDVIQNKFKLKLYPLMSLKFQVFETFEINLTIEF
jgi:hypothetical protein